MTIRLGCTVAALFCGAAFGHAPPVYMPAPPLQVRDAAIVDSTGTRVLLRGVVFDALEIDNPNPITYRLIRQRWNSNAVRIPLRLERWRSARDAYLDRAAAAVQAARREGLIVFVALAGEAHGSLPGPETKDFWTAAAARFRDDPGVIFSLYDEPSPEAIPGFIEGVRASTDWTFWRDGGSLINELTAIGMQTLVEAIRNAGAVSQLIAAPAFHDASGFQGFSESAFLADANVIYELHPSYANELTDEQRQANFGFLRSKAPLYAGSWGMPFGRDEPACRAIPVDAGEASALLLQTLVWFDTHDISWTASGFAPGGELLRDFDQFNPTDFPQASWSCTENPGSAAGIGSTLLLWTTGDPLGFGSILPEYVASLAGGPPGDLSPGQLVGFFGQGLGPVEGATAQLDLQGKSPAELGGVRIYFNSVPAAILFADSFQIYAQAPYEIAGESSVEVQLYFRDVPSNRIRLGVAPATPEPFTQRGSVSDILAQNEDGSGNSASNPAARGSTVTLTATGSGQTNPPGVTGLPSVAPPALPMEVTIGQKPAQVLFWRGLPTQPGRQEIAVRIPSDLTVSGASQRVQVLLRTASYVSRSGVVLWIR